MQLRGSKRATAAVAVLGTLLGGAVASSPPGAVSAPSVPSTPGGSGTAAKEAAAASAPGPLLDPGADTPRTAAEGPAVWPRPQSMAADPAREVPLGAEAVLVAPSDADPHAVQVVRDALRAAGVRTVHERAPGAPLPERGTVVRLQGPDAQEALRALGAAEARDLPEGATGWRWASPAAGTRSHWPA